MNRCDRKSRSSGRLLGMKMTIAIFRKVPSRLAETIRSNKDALEVTRRNIRRHRARKSRASPAGRVAEVVISVEDVFKTLQQREMIEWRVGHRSGREEARQEHSPGAIAAVALERQRVRTDRARLRKGRRFGPGCSLQQKSPGALITTLRSDSPPR